MAALATAVLLTSVALGALAPLAKTALAAAGDRTITFSNGGRATLRADGSITGHGDLGEPSITHDPPYQYYNGSYFTMPDGQRLWFECYESYVGAPDHSDYNGPVAADDVAFTATPNGDGSYFVLVHSQDLAGCWGGDKTQRLCNVDGWRPVITGSLRIVKSSATPALTEGNALYSLSGAVYGVYSDRECTTEVGRLVTDTSGATESLALTVGTYYVREVSAPRGFRLDDTVSTTAVSAGATRTLRLSDAPASDSLGLVIQKVDAQGSDATGWDAQGDATLEGAEFTIRFYEGHYDSISELPEKADRTWVVSTRASGERVRARLTDGHKVSGDPWYATDAEGRALLPLGTLSIQETKAPAGYVISDASTHLAQVVEDGGTATGASIRKLGPWPEAFDQEDAGAGLAIVDQVVRGGVSVSKIDHDLEDGVAQGDATLAGATISVTNASQGDVVVNGTRYAPGQEVATITTDEAGHAATAPDTLPFGTYALREKTPPRGYELNDEWSATVSVQQQGAVAAAPTSLDDEVSRGGGSIVKADGDLAAATAQGDATLEGAVVSVYSRSEATVVVSGVAYQPGDVVARLTLGADGSASTGTVLPYGTYEARETSAPEGYLLNEDWSRTFKVERQDQVVELDGLCDQVVRGGVSVAKVDHDLMTGAPQGDSTLAGAEFTVYNRSEAAVVVSGSAYQPGDAVVTVATGEGGIASTAADLLPYGTYEVRETAAPEGYLLNEDWSRTFEVRSQGQVVSLTGESDVADDRVVRGGVSVRKVDRELVSQEGHGGAGSASVPLGSATLEGTVFEVTNDSPAPVVVDGVEYQSGDVVRTLTADKSGTASTAADLLPYGTYTVREAAAPEGYLTSDGWSRTFEVREDGRVHDLTADSDAVDDQVIRGDVSLQKSSAGGGRMAGVPFRITSVTTGEWHVVVTDENGMIDTSSEWNSHETRTNASDAALLADGTVDDARLDSRAGVWFSGRADATTRADDALGALPYDTYGIEELRCAANEGHELLSATVTVTRDGTNLDLGTFDDEPTQRPGLDTTATSQATGDHDLPALPAQVVTDVVHATNLVPGEKYTMSGELRVREAREDGTFADGGALTDADGAPAAATATFTAEASEQDVALSFEVDASALEGRSVVAFETLSQGDATLAVHADANDQDQVVHVPGMGTTLADASDGDHQAPATSETSLTDRVELTGLLPGREYRVTGTLHLLDTDETGAAVDAGALLAPDGAPVSATTTFTAEATYQSVELHFSFDASEHAGRTVVAFDELRRDDVTLVSHTDIADENQSVLLAQAPSSGGSVPRTGEGPDWVMPLGAVGACLVAPLLARLARARTRGRRR